MSSASRNFECKMHLDPPVLSIGLYRELDVAAADRLEWPAWAEDEGITLLLMDLRGLTFCDVAGLTVVQRLCDTARRHGWKVQVLGVSPVLRRVARITGVAEEWVLQD